MDKLKVIKEDGSVEECDATFAACQKAVEGYVEVIRVADGVLLVNEEGLIKGMIGNLTASAIADRVLVGPVVVVPKKLVKKVLG